MRAHTLFALLPALAFALPQDPTITSAPTDASDPNDLSDCETAEGAAGIYCILTVEGFNPAAASYLASVENDPAYTSVIDDVLNQPAIAGPLSSIEASVAAAFATATVLPESIYAGVLASVVSQHLGEVPSGTGRDVVSSIFAELGALQAGATPAPTGPAAGTSGAPASAGTSTGAAPRQTGLGVMAGVMVGVVGMAVAL